MTMELETKLRGLAALASEQQLSDMIRGWDVAAKCWP